MISKDDIELGEFSNNEHFALGGGGFYDNKDHSIYLAIGSAAAADNLISNAKAQEDSSLFGKVIKISILNNKFKLIKPSIFTKGHRNPQGMVSIDNKIFSVEHGPKGGDEINLLYANGNYGWNKFSYGTKYGKADKSYSNYSSKFIDPIFYFTPSIGISDIYSCPGVLNDPGYKNCLIISSMRDKSFYIAKLNPNKDAIQSLERISLGSRIRKIRSSENSIFLFTDDQSIVKINYIKL
jgi:glucose/arabinose dehydrogenase